MTDQLFRAALIGLAASALVNAWLHSGNGDRPGLFDTLRDAIEYWGHDPAKRVRHWLASLLLCRFCLTYHVAVLLGAVYYSIHFFAATTACYVADAVLVVVAAIGVAQLVHRYMYLSEFP